MTKSSLETVTLFDIRSSLMHCANIGVAPPRLVKLRLLDLI